MIFRRTSPRPPQIPPTGPQVRPASPQPADVPADDSPDIPHVSTPDNAMVAAPVYPHSAEAMARVYERASIALENVAKTLSTFSQCRVYQFDAASYYALTAQAGGGKPPQPVVNLSFGGPAIRSVYIRFGTVTSAGNAALSLFISSPNGNPFMTINLKTYQIMPVGSGIFDLHMLMPTNIATSTPITVVISDDVWAPSSGLIV